MATRINNVNLHQLDILNRRHKPTRIAEREKKFIQRTLFVGFFFCWPFDKVIQWQALVSYFLFSLFPSMGKSVSGLFSILTFFQLFLSLGITLNNISSSFIIMTRKVDHFRQKPVIKIVPGILRWLDSSKNTPIFWK